MRLTRDPEARRGVPYRQGGFAARQLAGLSVTQDCQRQAAGLPWGQRGFAPR